MKFINTLEFKKKTNYLRRIDLISIVRHLGCLRDKNDKHKWHTLKGPISINGSKFINWHSNFSGGGAIDLTMHLLDLNFENSICWLSKNIYHDYVFDEFDNKFDDFKFKLPKSYDENLTKVSNYLVSRCIPIQIIRLLLKQNKLYADIKENAVFILLGENKNIVGAEIRGTNKKNQWRGMAKGSCKKLGFFSIKDKFFKKIVLCESAIDACSYYTLDNCSWAISTSGVTTNPLWLQILINLKIPIYCGFDNDKAGIQSANIMIKKHASIKRLYPKFHDWNEDLCFLNTSC